MSAAKVTSRPLSLALQGGGSHGAFTWGVLDRLLEEPDIHIAAVSGASAGAMNAAVLAQGYVTEGREGARTALHKFWERVAGNVQIMPSAFTRLFSPYQLNPLGINALRGVLEQHVDFGRLRDQRTIELFIAATHVASGAARIFTTTELTVEVLLASACVPTLHHAIEIGGAAYWDGGLTANPPLYPLIGEHAPDDLLIVLLNPARPQLPTTNEAIWQRLAEISVSSAVQSELRGLSAAMKEAQHAVLPSGRWLRQLRRLKLHLIDAPDVLGTYNAASKLDTNPRLIYGLRDRGRESAEAWLEANSGAVGVRSSLDFARLLGFNAAA